MKECKGDKNVNSARMRVRPTIEELQQILAREPAYPVEITAAGEVMPMGLRLKIKQAVNSVSAENGSNTPDFILAEYLMSCLAAFDLMAHKHYHIWIEGRCMIYGAYRISDYNNASMKIVDRDYKRNIYENASIDADAFGPGLCLSSDGNIYQLPASRVRNQRMRGKS